MILFPVVIGIWSIIIYKIYSAIHQEAVGLPSTAEIKLPDIIRPEETPKKFELNEVFRDPFLDKVYKQRNTSTPKNKIKKVEWPVVHYLGLITTTTSKEKIAIFKINSQEVLLSIGEDFQGMKVLVANSNSAKIRYKYEQRSFSK